jgi:hypothetical protein
VRRTREGVEQVADAHRHRVGEVEALTVPSSCEVGNVIHRGDDEVDRDHVDSPAFDADGRHPGGEHLAHFLDQLEEVVGPVDLVHFAGARVADNDRRAEDAPGNLALLADDAFGVVLGAEVGVVEVFRFVEHVFAKQSFERGRQTQSS